MLKPKTIKYLVRRCMMFLLLILGEFGWTQASLTRFELQQLVQKNDIRSIEQLLPLLPMEYREHYAMVHTGKGAQQTSFENPRILMFGRNAKMVMAFNGHPSQAGFYDLEFREFNESNGQFEYGSLHFGPQMNPPVFSEVNPKSCLSCHGNKPLPILDHYFSSWEGFYQDRSQDSQVETYQAEFFAWIKGAPSHPRYGHLQQKYLPIPYDDGIYKAPPENALYQPLNMLTKLQSRYVGRHIAAEISKDPAFGQLRYSYLYLHLVRHILGISDQGVRQACLPDDYLRTLYQFMRTGLIERFKGESFGPHIVTRMRFDSDRNRFDFSLLPLLFSYHDEKDRYGNSRPPHNMIPATFRDGVDAPYLHSWMVFMGEEIHVGTTLGKLLEWDNARMASEFSRYKGESSLYLDEALTWVYLDPWRLNREKRLGLFKEICEQLVPESKKELAQFNGWQ